MLLYHSRKLSSILLESKRMNVYGSQNVNSPYDVLCGFLVHVTVTLMIHHKMFLGKTVLSMPCLEWACTYNFQNLDVFDALSHALFSIHTFLLRTRLWSKSHMRAILTSDDQIVERFSLRALRFAHWDVFGIINCDYVKYLCYLFMSLLFSHLSGLWALFLLVAHVSPFHAGVFDLFGRGVRTFSLRYIQEEFPVPRNSRDISVALLWCNHVPLRFQRGWGYFWVQLACETLLCHDHDNCVTCMCILFLFS